MHPNRKPYPFLPEGKTILYSDEQNPFMRRARELCLSHKRFCRIPTAAVIAKDGKIIGEGRNGGENPPEICQRKLLGVPTGQNYELCPGCDPENHAEAGAIRNAEIEKCGGADLYLYGHWWCCEPCWEKMISAGIVNVYLAEGASELFS